MNFLELFASSIEGIQDVASGLVVLTMMLTAHRQSVGIALIVYAIILLGDMSIVLGSGGSKRERSQLMAI